MTLPNNWLFDYLISGEIQLFNCIISPYFSFTIISQQNWTIDEQRENIIDTSTFQWIDFFPFYKQNFFPTVKLDFVPWWTLWEEEILIFSFISAKVMIFYSKFKIFGPGTKNKGKKDRDRVSSATFDDPIHNFSRISAKSSEWSPRRHSLDRPQFRPLIPRTAFAYGCVKSRFPRHNGSGSKVLKALMSGERTPHTQ